MNEKCVVLMAKTATRQSSTAQKLQLFSPKTLLKHSAIVLYSSKTNNIHSENTSETSEAPREEN